MNKRKLSLTVIAVFCLLLLVVNVSAITGSLGNSRMILNLGVGEIKERYLNVINNNDVSVEISLTFAGDLADNLKLKDAANFTLAAGEEKKVYFTIKADEAGTTETKVNVVFTPADGPGIIMPATIIVVASEEGAAPDEEANPDETDAPNGDTNVDVGGEAPDTGQSAFKLSPLIILLILSTVLVIIFILLLVYAKKVNRKKRARRPSA